MHWLTEEPAELSEHSARVLFALQNFILLPTTQTDCKLSHNSEYDFQQSAKNNIKGHVGKLENYQFNISLVSEILSSITKGEKDLGISMTPGQRNLGDETTRLPTAKES